MKTKMKTKANNNVPSITKLVTENFINSWFKLNFNSKADVMRAIFEATGNVHVGIAMYEGFYKKPDFDHRIMYDDQYASFRVTGYNPFSDTISYEYRKFDTKRYYEIEGEIISYYNMDDNKAKEFNFKSEADLMKTYEMKTDKVPSKYSHTDEMALNLYLELVKSLELKPVQKI